ncbi:MAG: hypothetical protein HN576_13070 [Bacteriovoracaceae bacterium]|jgi:hypothetical protein|nr:hypothetical protein [Bacteriovoracaceae bacterium]
MIKNFIRSILLLTSLTLPYVSYGNMSEAWSSLRKSRGNISNYVNVIEELVDEGLYFTAIPYIKEYLIQNTGRRNKKLDYLIDEVITKVGVKQFEVLPSKYLLSSRSPMLSYVLAKKYFRIGKYNKALSALNGTIPGSHPAKPYALLLEGSAFSILKKKSSAKAAFKECISLSDSFISKTDFQDRKRQLEMNRDYCILGIPRVEFAKGKFDDADLSYLDLMKSSYVWPEILFEEAWNSFYQRDYNRALGKLVTYKAPVLDYIFNPEVEILRALTYLELCLWSDTKRVVNNFYNKFQLPYQQLRFFLKKHRRDYKYFYLLAKSASKGRERGSKLLSQMLKSVLRDPAFIELYRSFHFGKSEIKYIKSMQNKKFARILNVNLKESLLLQRNLIGAYVRKSLHLMSSMVNKTMQDMSYIKLEVLARKKGELYQTGSMNRGRGDIKYLTRNDKQYFWSFNGEFWADELGDYVFSLKSECVNEP